MIYAFELGLILIALVIAFIAPTLGSRWGMHPLSALLEHLPPAPASPFS